MGAARVMVSFVRKQTNVLATMPLYVTGLCPRVGKRTVATRVPSSLFDGKDGKNVSFC
jgi:hypothetical protein